MAPVIHHLAKDRLGLYIMSFIMNIHSMTNAGQCNDFNNNLSSVTSTSNVLFAFLLLLLTGVLYFKITACQAHDLNQLLRTTSSLRSTPLLERDIP